MTKKHILISYKTFFALLGFSAIVTEIATIVERGRFIPANFFSFFTIESNIFAVVVFLMSALAIASGKQGRGLTMLRGAATLYMVTTGIVFALLLAGIEGIVLTAVPWDNMVLHYLIPVAALVDWFIDPPKSRIRFKKALVWMVFPLTYVAYSLIRGPFVDWYPYPFLNPATNGYGGVAVVSVGIATTVLVLIWLLTRLPLKR